MRPHQLLNDCVHSALRQSPLFSLNSVEKNWDTIVIGGGPAGSTVARYAAQEGVKVLVIDREVIGSPLQCGELVPTNGS